MKDIFDYFAAQRDRHVAELCTFLSIPSVSTRSEHKGDVARAATWVASSLERAGLEDVVINPTKGHPCVTGHTPHVAGAPTVLVYGHYDVQPPEPLELWKSPAFAPEIRQGRIYARGAADDKGQVFLHLKVLEAYKAVRGGCPINVKVLIEGEEEIGSPNLVPFVKANKKLLACDAVIVSDTHMLGVNTPSITVGLRGLAALQMTVRAAKSDLHSGTFGGGVANPLQVLAEILVGCKDPKSGKIKIPGFYDQVRKLGAADKKALALVPHDDAAWLKSTGAPALFGEAGFGTLARIGARPTFEINGMWGGYTGEGVKTVLPSEAHAKISMRLVPDQDPREIVKLAKAHIEAIAPDHVKVDVRIDKNMGSPSFVDPNFPAMAAAARAVERVFKKAPAFTREGGSIPIVADFERVLGRPTVLLGFGLPDDGLHAPNEKFDLRMFDKGVRTLACLIDELAAAQR
ncbi:MAG: dipeptidase [Myxococcales bacterium]|nr:dipeptidase [Myxococcales bacterium]